jgi:predicted transposase/invertase (TIGR01784 family)
MTDDIKDLDELDLLPPSDDGIFKSLLTRPESKPILRDVMASYLNLPIAEVSIRNVETPIFNVGEKRQRFDINCILDDDKQVEVEMQTEAMDGDSHLTEHKNIKGRAILNLCDIHAKQEAKGDDYSDIMRSFQITICGYTVFTDRKEHISRFSFRDESGYELSDTPGIVFVELTKLDAVTHKAPEEMTPAEMWSVFIKYADKPKYRHLINKLTTAREEIKMATEVLTSISKDETERANYHTRLVLQRDNAHTKAVMRREGRAEGRSLGHNDVLELMRKGYTLDQIERELEKLCDNSQ